MRIPPSSIIAVTCARRASPSAFTPRADETDRSTPGLFSVHSGAYIGNEPHRRSLRPRGSRARHGVSDSGREIQGIPWQYHSMMPRRHGDRALRHPGVYNPASGPYRFVRSDLATVLFLDIALPPSARRRLATRLGAILLNSYYATVRKELGAFGGRNQHHLATVSRDVRRPSATGAPRVAMGSRSALGIEVRAGVPPARCD